MSTWPRIYGRSPEERAARRDTDLEKRVAALERQKTNTFQGMHVGLTGSPLVGSITTATATLISGTDLTVEVPDTNSIVLVGLTTEIDVSTVAAAGIRIGIVETTDFTLAGKTPLVTVTSDNAVTTRSWTGYDDSTFTVAGGKTSVAHQQGHLINPYQKWGASGPITPYPTPGTRTYQLSRWRETGTGTGRIWSVYFWVMVIPTVFRP